MIDRDRPPGIKLVLGQPGEAIVAFDVESSAASSRAHGYAPAVRLTIGTITGARHVFEISSLDGLREVMQTITATLSHACERAYLDVAALEAEIAALTDEVGGDE